ncbi:MAG: trp operon repressor [Treponema sp.]|nr:trp operon repressor [Treponema sp.]
MNNSNTAGENKSGISEELVHDTIKELSKLMLKSGDEKFLYDFLVCLLSTPELKSIASRWLLVKDIDAGITQREIAKKYGMSLCKITRGSKELNKPDSAFRKMLELLKNM